MCGKIGNDEPVRGGRLRRLKWLVSEEHRYAGSRLLRETHDMIAPDLFFSEVGNVLWKKCQQGQIDAEKAGKALRGLLSAGLEIHAADRFVCDALDISLGHGCSVYDGVYLALAARERCPLVTADRKFMAMMSSTEFAQRMVWIENIGQL